jgi:phage tail-like protein
MSTNGVSTHEFNYVATNRFYIEMESQITASFSECSGLGVTIKRDAQYEGGVNDQQRILLGQAEFSDVTLKRGMTDDFLFWNWINQILGDTKKERRNINILLFNQAGETMQSWTLIGAIPVGWKAPALQANADSLAIEELTIAYEGLKIIRSNGGGATIHKSGRDASGYFPGN